MRKIFRNLALLLFTSAAASQICAQPGGGFAPQVKPTVVNADGTVTFNYSNRNAGKVQVWTQFSGDVDMQKGANGTWSATIGPAVPDNHTISQSMASA